MRYVLDNGHEVGLEPGTVALLSAGEALTMVTEAHGGERNGLLVIQAQASALEGSIFYNDVKNGHVNAFGLTASQFTIAALDYRTWGFEAGARESRDSPRRTLPTSSIRCAAGAMAQRRHSTSWPDLMA
ncbi:MAG: hypothetical protein QHC90_22300 [Shinella sp.]|nr:hypothetical protein [Shinella sp.]